jgi:hypothetical protein
MMVAAGGISAFLFLKNQIKNSNGKLINLSNSTQNKSSDSKQNTKEGQPFSNAASSNGRRALEQISQSS